ncbi:MAG TPA: CopG family transcriptional regulator [Kosmotogaceae bacterium]|nr:CopG family transcriptional regulator [Kosmotogaceae bacterium]
MPKDKVAITIEKDILRELDLMVKEKNIPSRSKAIEDAISQLIENWRKNRLYEQLRNLDVEAEKAEAEASVDAVNEAWQKY